MPSPSTPYQQEIARRLGIDVTSETQAVAGARILDIVERALDPDTERRSATPRQIEFARKLGLDPVVESFHVCSAQIDDHLRTLNEEAIARLQLKPGDRVIKTDSVEIDGQEHTLTREYVISSIGANGRVWFKGGNGAGAWPTQLAPASTISSEEDKRRAE
jgi:flavin-dependent dehydrogenase